MRADTSIRNLLLFIYTKYKGHGTLSSYKVICPVRRTLSSYTKYKVIVQEKTLKFAKILRKMALSCGITQYNAKTKNTEIFRCFLYNIFTFQQYRRIGNLLNTIPSVKYNRRQGILFFQQYFERIYLQCTEYCNQNTRQVYRSEHEQLYCFLH